MIACADSLDVEIVKALLKAGADPDFVARDGFMSLHVCAMKGNIKAAKSLIDIGADVNAVTPRCSQAR